MSWVRMAASPGDHIMVRTNIPPCTFAVPALMIGMYESALNKTVRDRKTVIFFWGDMIFLLGFQTIT